MARSSLLVLAILGFISHSLHAQQTYNEKLRARLAQPLVTPKPLKLRVEQLSHPDARVRNQAIEFWNNELQGLSLFSPILDGEWLEIRELRRRRYVSLLPEFRKLFQRAERQPELFQVDEKSDSSSVDAALSVLSVIGVEAGSLSPPIRKIAVNPEIPFMTRMQAFSALLALTPEEDPVLPLLISVLDARQEEPEESFGDEGDRQELNEQIRYQSIGFGVNVYTTVLSRTGHTKSEVPSLIKIAQGDYSLDVRATAIGILGQLSFDAKAALPDLRKLLKDTNPIIRELAVSSVLMIEDDESLIPQLLPFLKLEGDELRETEQSLREYFADQRAMREKYPEMLPDDELGKQFLKSLLEFLRYGSGFEQRHTIQLLGDIGPNAKAALPELRQALQDPDEDTRRMAAAAIKQIEQE